MGGAPQLLLVLLLQLLLVLPWSPPSSQEWHPPDVHAGEVAVLSRLEDEAVHLTLDRQVLVHVRRAPRLLAVLRVERSVRDERGVGRKRRRKVGRTEP